LESSATSSSFTKSEAKLSVICASSSPMQLIAVSGGGKKWKKVVRLEKLNPQRNDITQLMVEPA